MQSHFTSHGVLNATDAPAEETSEHPNQAPPEPSSRSTRTSSMPLALPRNTYSTNQVSSQSVTQAPLTEQLPETQDVSSSDSDPWKHPGKAKPVRQERPGSQTRKQQCYYAEMSSRLQMDVTISFSKTRRGECGGGDRGKEVGMEMDLWEHHPLTHCPAILTLSRQLRWCLPIVSSPPNPHIDPSVFQMLMVRSACHSQEITPSWNSHNSQILFLSVEERPQVRAGLFEKPSFFPFRDW